MSPIACVGCHGRLQDDVPANPETPGVGAGLRQHHDGAGVTVCRGCHQDADPANYTAVGEGVLPDYYVNPGSGHAGMPTSGCNTAGGENYAGDAMGLDNDGNGIYDGNDPGCAGSPVEPTTWGLIKSLYRMK